MTRTNHIIAAVHQFPQDDPVIARAAELASLHGARLTIVTVIEPVPAWVLDPEEQEQVRQQAEADARDRLATALGACIKVDQRAEIRIELGSAAERLIELTQSIDVDLIVMRVHQNKSIRRKLVGSTTDRVVRATSVPVLVVKRPVERDYERVVVGVDIADKSDNACCTAVAWCPTAEIRLVHVVQVPAPFDAAMLRAGAGQARIQAYQDALAHQAKVFLRACCKRLEDRRVRTSMRVINGIPSQALLRLTRAPGTGLIALEPGSRSRIRQALLGSVTRRLLREAACDVLICRSTGHTSLA